LDKVRPTRLQELDALRGLAALAVVLFHYTFRFGHLFGFPSEVWSAFHLGHHGVYLFFLISGFVIFMTLERTRTALDFVVARLSRLFPAYWAAVALTATVMAATPLPGRTVSGLDALLNLTMLQHWLRALPVDGVYWTLTIELIFYGLMLCFFALGCLKRIEWVCAGWLTLVLVAALAGKAGLWVSPEIELHLILKYANLFMAGMMFYKLRRGQGSLARHAIIAACLATQFLISGLETALTITAFFALFYLLVWDRLAFLKARPLVFLGTISYPLYLIHQNIGYALLRALLGQGLEVHLSIALALAAAVLVATLITFTVERPALSAIRGRYKRARAQPAASPAGKSVPAAKP
jgi:peptidoglycan/LPS O-acetylase OafA/YrhL